MLLSCNPEKQFFPSSSHKKIFQRNPFSKIIKKELRHNIYVKTFENCIGQAECSQWTGTIILPLTNNISLVLGPWLRYFRFSIQMAP